MADILIRMEMPSKGYKTVILHSNGSVYEPTSNELILNKIADATVLPPHGDLIDRDALPKGRVEWDDIVNAPVIIPSNKEETE